MDTIEVLDSSGHLTLTWDPTDEEQVQKAREDVERLRAAGYSFFAVVGSQGSDEVEAGNGTLLVERIADPIRPPVLLPTVERPPEEPAPASDVSPPKRGKGRPKKALAGPSTAPAGPSTAPAGGPGRRVVAVRPMAGG